MRGMVKFGWNVVFFGVGLFVWNGVIWVEWGYLC